MAIGDIIDIGGRAHREVEASQPGNENPQASYAPLFASEEGAASATAIGKTDDAPWDGTSADATVISLLKAIALNTAP